VPGDEIRTTHYSTITDYRQLVNGEPASASLYSTLYSEGAGHFTQLWQNGSPASWNTGMSFSGAEFFILEDNRFDFANTNLTLAAIRSIPIDVPIGVPEPSTFALLLLGLGSLFSIRLFRRADESI
jgi:hypothetical protein